MSIVAASEGAWNAAREHLLCGDTERYGYFLAGVTNTPTGTRFCVREFVPVLDNEADTRSSAERSVNLDTLLRILNEARKAGLAVIECHTHPFATRGVRFSPLDEKDLPETAAYVMDSLKRPYAALVFGTESVDGRWYDHNGPHPIGRIVISGATQAIVPTTSGRHLARREHGRYDRHALLLGPEGQLALDQRAVAIVGLSGLGSHVAVQLAYLGVRRFALIDPELVEESNLNRMVGATPEDIGRPKVEVIAREIRRIAPTASVNAEAGDVRTRRARVLLASCDTIFGCVDNDGARLVLNELARACNIALFDLASGVEAPNGTFEGAGGRVAVVTPGGPCLLCMGEIDRREAAYFLAPPEKQEQDRRLGYVDGWAVTAPSVVSLNGTIASMAVSEFLLYSTGLATASPLTYYYMREPGAEAQRAARRAVQRNFKCYTCSLEGLGDLAGTDRFAQGGDPLRQA